jgi:hypothetical protein
VEDPKSYRLQQFGLRILHHALRNVEETSGTTSCVSFVLGSQLENRLEQTVLLLLDGSENSDPW